MLVASPVRQSGDAEEASAVPVQQAQPVRQKRGKRRGAHCGNSLATIARSGTLPATVRHDAQRLAAVDRRGSLVSDRATFALPGRARPEAARFSVQTDFSRC